LRRGSSKSFSMGHALEIPITYLCRELGSSTRHMLVLMRGKAKRFPVLLSCTPYFKFDFVLFGVCASVNCVASNKMERMYFMA